MHPFARVRLRCNLFDIIMFVAIQSHGRKRGNREKLNESYLHVYTIIKSDIMWLTKVISKNVNRLGYDLWMSNSIIVYLAVCGINLRRTKKHT